MARSGDDQEIIFSHPTTVAVPLDAKKTFNAVRLSELATPYGNNGNSRILQPRTASRSHVPNFLNHYQRDLQPPACDLRMQPFP